MPLYLKRMETNMLTIVYDPNFCMDGLVFPDGECEKYVREVIETVKLNTGNLIIHTGQELVIDCFRLEVCKGMFPSDQMEFLFLREDGITEKLLIDKYGRLDRWPVGFCGYRDEINETLLLWRIYLDRN